MDPEGTVTVNSVVVPAVTNAFTPPKYTTLLVAVASKFVPVIVTDAPTGAPVGEKEVIDGGGGTTVKLLDEDPVPFGDVTLISPVVAPVGTVAVMLVALFTVKFVAFVPLKLTTDAPVKFVPVKVTVEPTRPKAGETLVILGAGVGKECHILTALVEGDLYVLVEYCTPSEFCIGVVILALSLK